MSDDHTPAADRGSGLSAQLGPLLAEADMDALKAVAHQAGLSGIDLHKLARLLDAAQRIAATEMRERCAKAVEALRDRHCASTAGECQADDNSCDFVVAWNDAVTAIRGPNAEVTGKPSTGAPRT